MYSLSAFVCFIYLCLQSHIKCRNIIGIICLSILFVITFFIKDLIYRLILEGTSRPMCFNNIKIIKHDDKIF